MMLVYPQLLTGTVCQYPITRRNARRTLTNNLADGTTIRVSDIGAASVSWDLTYSQLSSDEVGAIQGLFTASNGEWASFTFLDPASNLLRWSEDFSQTVWRADPLLTLGAGLTDPLGGTAATKITNASQTSQELSQTLEVPGWFQYCLSLYVRSDESAQVELFASNGSTSAEAVISAGSDWRRVVHSFQLPSHSPALDSGIRLAAGASASIFGLQLEAQLGTGAYMKTSNKSGVYPKTRFQGGTFRPIATGMGQFACSVTVVANVAG